MHSTLKHLLLAQYTISDCPGSSWSGDTRQTRVFENAPEPLPCLRIAPRVLQYQLRNTTSEKRLHMRFDDGPT